MCECVNVRGSIKREKQSVRENEATTVAHITSYYRDSSMCLYLLLSIFSLLIPADIREKKSEVTHKLSIQ